MGTLTLCFQAASFSIHSSDITREGECVIATVRVALAQFYGAQENLAKPSVRMESSDSKGSHVFVELGPWLAVWHR